MTTTRKATKTQTAQEPPRGSILVVDDEPGVMLTIQAILAQEGYAVDSASSGAQALTKLRERAYDLVLTDLRLGDLDGLDVLTEIRRTSPRTVAIVLTGYASLESAIQAMRQGAYDYLVKPTDVEELKLRVAHIFERLHLSDELERRVRELETANATIDHMNANLREEVESATAQLRDRVTELAFASPNFTRRKLRSRRNRRNANVSWRWSRTTCGRRSAPSSWARNSSVASRTCRPPRGRTPKPFRSRWTGWSA
jgi:DNA-binding response OmpR family regulator